MDLVLGIDGGGTHTRARLARAGGAIVGSGEAGRSNPNAQGLPAAQEQVLQAVELAFRQAGISRDKVAAACLGIGGTDRPAERAAWTAWALEHLAVRAVVVNDGEILLAAGTPENWGVALVAGTGSIAWGKSRAGQNARAGGWGYLFGDEGSGFELGREALRAAAQAADGRGPETKLLAAILEHWGCREPMELIPRVYRDKARPADLAALAPLITRCAQERDPVARRLVAQAAEALATMVRAVCRALDFRGEIPLAMTGGLLLATESLRTDILRSLDSSNFRMQPVALVQEPVQGAIRLAQALAGKSARHERHGERSANS